MMLANKLMGAGAEPKLYVDDVFSSWAYQSTGGLVSIDPGIDMEQHGGLAWLKDRSATSNHYLCYKNTASLNSNTTSSAGGGNATFTSTGIVDTRYAASGNNQIAWLFRNAPGFLASGEYTGNGVAGRQIPHSLGVAPGMVIVKKTSSTGTWWVWHRYTGTSDVIIVLNSTSNGYVNDRSFFYAAPNDAYFTVTSDQSVNESGASYVWYAFAHDPSTDGIIQCGSFTTDASGNATVDLGWEPQFVVRKTSSTAGNWGMYDVMRGMAVSGNNAFINADESASEYSEGAQYMRPNATGFSTTGVGPSTTHIYLAIRRPNKPPTSGTEVYNAIAYTGDSGTNRYINGAGFPVDVCHIKSRSNAYGNGWFDRLRGSTKGLDSNSTIAEYTETDGVTASFDIQNGVRIGNNDISNNTGMTYINHFFRRAPGFMDVVCYTGTGVARTVPHNLQAVPELIIVKNRTVVSGSGQWIVYAGSLGATKWGQLHLADPFGTWSGAWNDTQPTYTVFTVGSANAVNYSGDKYVAYLFASLPGISKVGSYTGNGTSQTIDCGFTTGCRFFLVKATSTTGSWWIFDSARGIVSSFDPALQLNSNAAEITSADAVDPDASGIVVNQEATCSINTNGVSYVYLAIS